MEAAAYLKQFVKDYPLAGAVLSGGVAVFAAVAVVEKFGDPGSKLPTAVYVLGTGVVLYLLASVLSDPNTRRSLGYFLVAMIFGWIAAFFTSKLYPEKIELACAVYFWVPCVVKADAITDEYSVKPKVSVPTSAALSPEARAKFRVFIQFAGYSRTTIVSLASQLSAQGWDVQGAEQGGERLGSAAGLAEVRYGPDDALPAAEALATALNGSKVTSRVVKAKQLSIINKGVLEVWIGQ